MTTVNLQERYRQARRVTLIGIVVNTLLALSKTAAGVVGHSQALLADGVHSFSDAGTDLLVLCSAKIGSRSPDANHPYGHARIETITTMLLSLALLLMGLWIAIQALVGLLHPERLYTPPLWTLVPAVISVAANEWLYQITCRVGERTRSPLLCSNAWHNRIDALSSAVVIVGIVGTHFSLPRLDGIAAIAVAALIIKASVDLAWPSVKELTDTGLSEEEIRQITHKILGVSGVKALHQLRTRSLGTAIFTDVHVQVASDISVSEGHEIADRVYACLLHSGFDIADVLVHIDAEDDRDIAPTSSLPDRPTVEAELTSRCDRLPAYPDLARMQLHYLTGKLHIELYFPLAVLEKHKPEALRQQYQAAAASIPHLGDIKCYYF